MVLLQIHVTTTVAIAASPIASRSNVNSRGRCRWQWAEKDRSVRIQSHGHQVRSSLSMGPDPTNNHRRPNIASGIPRKIMRLPSHIPLLSINAAKPSIERSNGVGRLCSRQSWIAVSRPYDCRAYPLPLTASRSNANSRGVERSGTPVAGAKQPKPRSRGRIVRSSGFSGPAHE